MRAGVLEKAVEVRQIWKDILVGWGFLSLVPDRWFLLNFPEVSGRMEGVI